MSVQHFAIKHGNYRLRSGGRTLSLVRGAVTVTVVNSAINASFAQSTYVASPNSSVTIPVSYVGGADSSCIATTAGTITPAGLQITVGMADMTVAVSDTKAKVSVDNQFTAGIASLSPTSQFVAFNTIAAVTVQFNSGYSASDVEVSAGSISGNTWSIPVASTPVSATTTEAQPIPVGGTVHIGDTDYPYVQIGNLLWTAANLAEPIPGVAESETSKHRWAHNETDNTLGYGKLYDIGSIHNNAGNRRTSLETLFPAGWRIPTNADFENLKANCDSFRDLMRTDKGGNDRYGFAGLDTGQANTSGGACFEFTTFQLHTLGSYDTFVVSHSSSAYYLRFHNNGTGRMIAIRLVHDA